MREHDDRRVRRAAREVVLEPRELRLAQYRRRLRGVVEHDEVHALVIEGVVQRATEDFEVGLAAVERGVVLAVEVAHLRHREPGCDLLDLAQPRAAHGRIVGSLREVAGEHHEVRLRLERVDRGDRAQDRVAWLGVDLGVAVTPVDVGQLHEARNPRACRPRPDERIPAMTRRARCRRRRPPGAARRAGGSRCRSRYGRNSSRKSRGSCMTVPFARDVTAPSPSSADARPARPARYSGTALTRSRRAVAASRGNKRTGSPVPHDGAVTCDVRATSRT